MMSVNNKLLIPKSICTISYTKLKLNKSRSMPSGQEEQKRAHYRWVCSWREGDKTVTKYLGSCRKISQAEALEKSKKLKATALGLDSNN
jgi:hypothetical protein